MFVGHWGWRLSSALTPQGGNVPGHSQSCLSHGVVSCSVFILGILGEVPGAELDQGEGAQRTLLAQGGF